MLTLPTYVLITPARNEAEFIELTIRSVVAQTVRPLKWVILSDGSTDDTDDIVRKYVASCQWIELIRMPERHERHFAGKVNAFNAGWAAVKDLRYDIIANLDADVSFDAGYFEFLLQKFVDNPRLGVGGTPFKEGASQFYDYRFTSLDHVSGQCQLFRRECFEDIGGYVPRELGGIDLVAVLSARAKGWQTRTFIDKHFVHHRKMGTAKHSTLVAAFKGGHGDYRLGTHPLWEFVRTFYQFTRSPLIIGACLRLAGFCWAMICRADTTIPIDLVHFRRAEQMGRLNRFARKALRLHDHRSNRDSATVGS